MSKLIGDIMKPWIKYKKLEGTYGVEIEAETDCSSNYPSGFFIEKYSHKKLLYELPRLPDWEGHIDNSLRNFGMEFVFKKPLSYEAAIAALNDFGEKTKKVDFIKGSPSTSVHVHWNITKETFKTLANFIAVYMLYENILTAYSGPTRRSNLFALPMRVSETIVDNFIQMVKKINDGSWGGMKWDMYQTKYGALNPSNLGTLGSLEIRPFRGTTNVEDVKAWLSIIEGMVQFSRQTDLTPQIILDTYRYDPNSLNHQVFGNFLSDLRMATENEFEFLVEKNLWFLAVFAESVSDWGQFGLEIERVSDRYQDQATKKKDEISKLIAAKKQMVIDDAPNNLFNMSTGEMTPQQLGDWFVMTSSTPLPLKKVTPSDDDYEEIEDEDYEEMIEDYDEDI